MSIISIDIGTSTTKIIEYENNKIKHKDIMQNKSTEKVLKEFIDKGSIKQEKIEQIVLTGIGADKVKLKGYKVPIKVVDEFKAIANAGKTLTDKEKILVVSVGTGTAFVRVNKNRIKHLGGTRSWCRNAYQNL